MIGKYIATADGDHIEYLSVQGIINFKYASVMSVKVKCSFSVYNTRIKSDLEWIRFENLKN